MLPLLWAFALFAVASASGASSHLKQVLNDSDDTVFERTTDIFYIPYGQSSGELTYDENYNFCFLENGGQLLDLKVDVDEPSLTGLPPLIQFSEDLMSVRVYRQSTDKYFDGEAHMNLTVHCSYHTR